MSLAIKASRAATQGAGRVRDAGDPGLGSFLGKVARGAVGFVTGGPMGAVNALTQSRGRAPAPRPRGVNLPFSGPKGSGIPLPFGGRVSVGENGTEPKCESGFHPNKSDYFLKDGTFVPKGTRCVKNRRRNPLNPKALRRAVGRIDAGKVWQGKMREIETAKYTKAGNKKDC